MRDRTVLPEAFIFVSDELRIIMLQGVEIILCHILARSAADTAHERTFSSQRALSEVELAVSTTAHPIEPEFDWFETKPEVAALVWTASISNGYQQTRKSGQRPFEDLQSGTL